MTQKAFVHDRIVHMGGAEQVFIDLIRHFQSFSSSDRSHHNDKAPSWSTAPLVTSSSILVFTLFSNKRFLEIDNHKIPIIVALPRWINQLFVRGSRPESTKLCKLRTKFFGYRNLIVFYPLLTRLLARKINLLKPDLLVISSFAAVKNVIAPITHRINSKKPYTILYLHSPMQYIHENYEEYVRKLSKWQLRIFKPLAKKLRKRDLKVRAYDQIFTNSIYTSHCAKRYYGVDTLARYPRIEKGFIDTSPSTHPHSYFIYVGRLVRFIREVDLIIHLFNQLQLPLLIMGSGPDEYYLKSIAGDTITFIGQVDSSHERVTLIKNARGLVNLTKESCGMGTMEALAVGVPVFGYHAGATPELVDEKSGLLTDSKEMSTLVDMLGKFKETHFDRITIKQRLLEKINK